MAAQDPDEPFDLVDADGAPLGRVKARAAVHRDGDWHRSLHVWVLLTGDAEPWVVFQRRSRAKDTWPGALDVAVAGHYRAGEDLAQALRESEEEIGLELRPEDVERLGTRRRADDRALGIRDHEIQDIFLTRTPLRLGALRPGAEEVDELVAIPLPAAVTLFGAPPDASRRTSASGPDAAAPGQVLREGGNVEAAIVARRDFVDAADGYWQVVLSTIERRVAGAAHEPFRLGWPDLHT